MRIDESGDVEVRSQLGRAAQAGGRCGSIEAAGHGERRRGVGQVTPPRVPYNGTTTTTRTHSTDTVLPCLLQELSRKIRTTRCPAWYSRTCRVPSPGQVGRRYGWSRRH